MNRKTQIHLQYRLPNVDIKSHESSFQDRYPVNHSAYPHTWLKHDNRITTGQIVVEKYLRLQSPQIPDRTDYRDNPDTLQQSYNNGYVIGNIQTEHNENVGICIASDMGLNNDKSCEYVETRRKCKSTPYKSALRINRTIDKHTRNQVRTRIAVDSTIDTVSKSIRRSNRLERLYGKLDMLSDLHSQATGKRKKHLRGQIHKLKCQISEIHATE
jgi:hypothetical protein